MEGCSSLGEFGKVRCSCDSTRLLQYSGYLRKRLSHSVWPMDLLSYCTVVLAKLGWEGSDRNEGRVCGWEKVKGLVQGSDGVRHTAPARRGNDGAAALWGAFIGTARAT